MLARNAAGAARVAPGRARPVVFTANTGHELGHLGLDDFIARRPGWDREAAEGGALWVHYGANIGASGGTLSLVSPDAELRELATAELARAGQKHALAPPDLVPSGETRDIHRAGGRYLTLVGTQPAVSSAAGSLARRGRCRGDRADRRRRVAHRAGARAGLIAAPRRWTVTG